MHFWLNCDIMVLAFEIKVILQNQEGGDIMKVQSVNKLAHLQCEYNEQTQMLSNQLQPIQAELTQINEYLRANQGDRGMLSRFKELQRRYSSTLTQVRRNNQRLYSLSARISQEQARVQVQSQKMAISQQKQMARQQASMMRKVQKEYMRTGYR